MMGREARMEVLMSEEALPQRPFLRSDRSLLPVTAIGRGADALNSANEAPVYQKNPPPGGSLNDGFRGFPNRDGYGLDWTLHHQAI